MSSPRPNSSPNQPLPSLRSPTENVPRDLIRTEPLPPIGGSDDSVQPATSQTIDQSMAMSDNQNSNNRRPKILSYRRETSPNFYIPPTELKQDDERPEASSQMGRKNDAFEVVNVECQTEWSWLEEMQKSQEKASARSSAKSKGFADDAGSESDLSINDADLEGETPRGSAADGKGTSGTPRTRAVESEATFVDSEASIPFPSKEDEYGIPVLNLSSDSDSSDEESDIYKDYREDQDGDNAGTLPSIGPPSILQYQKESKRLDIEVDDPEVRADDERPPEQTTEQKAGIFDGKCEFCNNTIKPFPTIQDQKSRPPEELYCCEEYREFVQFVTTQPLHEEQNKPQKIDVKPHAPYGSKQARKLAKERAAQRMRERELARQQANLTQGGGLGGGGGGGSTGGAGMGGGGGGGGASTFYQFARQMKTINYQLSSTKCLEEGWTLRPPTPLFDDNGDPDVFEPEPVAENKRAHVEKYYEDGERFVILFEDGTGNVFYPSGNVAISITSIEAGMYSYIIQDDDGQVLAVFDPDGYAVSYYQNNNQVRVYLDQIGGIELDAKGSKKRKWSWKDQVQHVHAPPIQPITFAVTPNFGIRIMGQDHITLTFSCRCRAVRFQVGSKLKCVAPQYLPPPEVDEDVLFRNEVQNRVEFLFDKVNSLLKFPNSNRHEKFPAPAHLASKMTKVEKLKEMRKSNVQKNKTGVVTVN